MTLGGSIRTVYAKYATFGGRATRSEFWWFQLFNVLVAIPMGLTEITDTLWSLGNLLPILAVTARRLHDTDRSGWWQLLPLAGTPLVIFGAATGWDTAGTEFGLPMAMLVLGAVVFVGLAILLIIWLASRGTQGPNRFGDDPFGMADAEVFS